MAGNAALRDAVEHLRTSPEVKSPIESTPARANEPDAADVWRNGQDYLNRAEVGALRQRRLELEARIAEARRLPPRPSDAPPARGFMPDRYIVEGDSEYVRQIMEGTQLMRTQSRIDAHRVNELVDAMLAGQHVPTAIEQPVRVGNNMVGDGHHRLVAARIVSLRTGRPMFANRGPNAVFREPSPLLKELGTGAGLIDWDLSVRP